MLRNGACFSCISRITVLARCDASGSWRTGPPRGPGFNEITPWNSRRRSASRSVPRPVLYLSSIVRSGSSMSPGLSRSRKVSWTMLWARRTAALGGRAPWVTDMSSPYLAAITRRGSDPSPPWRSLLLEGTRTFPRILRGPHRFADRALPVEHLRPRPLSRLDDGLFGRGDGQRTVGRDGPGQVQGPVERSARCREPVDQAHLVGTGGGNELAGERPLHGEVVRDPLWQPDQAPAGRDEAALDLGQPELRVLGGHDHVAGKGDLEAAGDRVSLDRRDQRLRRGLLHDAGEPASRDRWSFTGEKGLEVHAGAEGAAGAGEDARDEGAVRLEPVHRLT